jgi:hypothetical protein
MILQNILLKTMLLFLYPAVLSIYFNNEMDYQRYLGPVMDTLYKSNFKLNNHKCSLKNMELQFEEYRIDNNIVHLLV